MLKRLLILPFALVAFAGCDSSTPTPTDAGVPGSDAGSVATCPNVAGSWHVTLSPGFPMFCGADPFDVLIIQDGCELQFDDASSACSLAADGTCQATSSGELVDVAFDGDRGTNRQEVGGMTCGWDLVRN